MKSVISSTLLLLLLPLVSSHFTLKSPIPRGFDEDKLGNFPCGGQDTVGDRTPWPIKGGPIQLNMEHDEANVQVLLGLGNDVGNHFNIVLQPTVSERGLGDFCLGDVVIPASLGVKDGQNATIQVVTNGDPNGGLYNCADITFQTSAQGGQCNNGTGVGATTYKGDKANANGTDASGVLSTSPSLASGSPSSASGSPSSASGSSATGTLSGTAAPAATSSHSAAAMAMEMSGWGFLGVVGAALALW